MNKIEFGAHQAVNNCVKLKNNERVVIITDNETKHLASAIQNECKKKTIEIQIFVMEDFGERPNDSDNSLKFPLEIKDTLSKADVSFYIAQGKPGELQSFRHQMLNTVESFGVRHAHMIGFTEQMMSEGMASDYSEIQKLSRKVYEIVKLAKEIRVTTSAGTDITAKFSPELKWVISDGNITDKHWSNLPDGEVFSAPITINGKTVIDGCLGDFFTEKYGDILESPVSFELKDGRAIKETVECKNEELKKDFLNYIFETDENSNRVGEFALGTNIGLKHLIGNLLQDEKFPGIHIALGSPYPQKTGANWNSKAHVDGVMRNCTIYVDGKMIMKDSKYVID